MGDITEKLKADTELNTNGSSSPWHDLLMHAVKFPQGLKENAWSQ